MAMILSAGMMLDWLGRRAGIDAMVRDAGRLRAAVDAVLAEGRTLTRDLGGDASTDAVAAAVTRALETAA
jgi:3-isopropylmalate dehydrogenase